MIRSALLRLAESRELARRLPRYRFARAAVRRFMPGEELDSALDAAAAFEPLRTGSVLTRLGENVHDRAEAAAVTDHYHDVLKRIDGRQLDARISVKLTQLGLDLDDALAVEHVAGLCAEAARYGNEIWIDMESSRYVDRTLALFRSVAAMHRNVGLCLQAYLRRTPDDLESLLGTSSAIRLVKGAYDETAAIAWRRRHDVDASFAALATRLVTAPRVHADTPLPVLATHDTALLDRITTALPAEGGSASAFEVQMLYGIRVAEQRRLAAAGWRVRVLISYGPAWFPWFMRRLAERPSNVLFVARNIVAR
jgi:proline dehydrogenase